MIYVITAYTNNKTIIANSKKDRDVAVQMLTNIYRGDKISVFTLIQDSFVIDLGDDYGR